MPIYFLSPEFDIERTAAIERKIRNVIPDLLKIKDIEGVARGGSGHPNEKNYVLLVTQSKESGHFAKLIDMALRYRDRIFFILISDDISAVDYKRLVRTGSADWVSANAVPHEVLEIISRRRIGSEAGSAKRAPVIACFVPSAGGVGNSTLAVEVAAQLKTSKTTSDRNICIVDLDFQNSHVCDHLDIEPRLQIQEISSDPERLDEQLFDIFISRHSSGLHIFAAPRTKFDFCDLNVAALDLLFDMISTRYDLVIIDLPVIWFSWTFQIISGSDGLIVTGLNTIPGLRQLAETMAAVRDARPAAGQLAVVVNRCARGLMGGVARRRHVEKVVGRQQVFYVRDDPAVLQSINTGTPMALTSASSKSSKEIALVGEFCAGLKSSRAAVM
jgi:pilus assembly protein CpaE